MQFLVILIERERPWARPPFRPPSTYCKSVLAYRDVGKGREQDAEALGATTLSAPRDLSLKRSVIRNGKIISD